MALVSFHLIGTKKVKNYEIVNQSALGSQDYEDEVSPSNWIYILNFIVNLGLKDCCLNLLCQTINLYFNSKL